MHTLNNMPLSSSLLVCFVPTPWPAFWAQALLAAMAQYVPTLLVEPPIDILSSSIRPGRLINRLKRYRKLTKLKPSLYLFQPFGLVSYGVTYRFPMFVHISKLLLRCQVASVLSQMPTYKHLIVQNFMPQQHYAFNVLQPDLYIFDIADEFYANANDEEIDFNREETIRYMQFEQKMFDRADLVFVSSRGLYDSRRKMHPRIAQIPVGCVDFELFSKARDSDLSIPDDIASIPSPRIGFIGNFNEKLDLELLVQLAQQRPDRSLVFIGAENGQASFKRSNLYRQLMGLPNVHNLGWRTYESLPAYMKAMDICLMPFRLNVWMKNSHPSKTYQYLAAGKPVVSTALPEVLSLDNVIAVTRNNEEFITAVEVALEKVDTNMDIAQRVEIGYQNSSKVRAEQRAVVIAELLEKPRQELKKR